MLLITAGDQGYNFVFLRSLMFTAIRLYTRVV